MSSQLNNLTVYLSKSLLIPESTLRPIRENLIGLGLNVTEYKEGTTYKDTLLKEADFVLFITNNIPSSYNKEPTNIIFDSFVGKGQYSEAEIVFKLNKPAFVYHYSETILDKKIIRVTKITNDEWVSRSPFIFNSMSWKKEYGIIHSYNKGISLINLAFFVEGAFYAKIHSAKLPYFGNIYPLTPEEAFMYNYKLLLL